MCEYLFLDLSTWPYLRVPPLLPTSQLQPLPVSLPGQYYHIPLTPEWLLKKK